MTTTEYVEFQTYMTSTKSRYQPSMFSQDIMYFCKIWKSHRQPFAQYCKKNGIISSYLALNQRCVDYETSLLEHKKCVGSICGDEFRQQLKAIQKVFL